jgi:hypothetical protein
MSRESFLNIPFCCEAFSLPNMKGWDLRQGILEDRERCDKKGAGLLVLLFDVGIEISLHHGLIWPIYASL